MNHAVVQRLASYLSTSEFRSLEEIAVELGCDQSVVSSHIAELRQLGIDIISVTGQGYLLKTVIEFLGKDTILKTIDSAVRHQLTGLKIETSVDSTNSALQRLPVLQQHANVILAEHQSTGRGRRGRRWFSPFARNVYLSLGWKFEKPLSELACLPLVVALATAHALGRAGLQGHLVKWPNDILLDGRKLCGCLVEVQGESKGPCHAILGVGINVHMPVSDITAGIDQPWTDLNSHKPACSRNKLVVLLLEELVGQLGLYAEQGFAPFQAIWQPLDALYGQVISVSSGNDSFEGTAGGIDETGALVLDTGKEILRFHSGEASLKKS